jgi:hypothetical protein
LNLGVGLERTLSQDWSIGGGYFRNSNRDDSVYFGATYAPMRFAGLKSGVVIGGVTGYEKSILPVILPSFTWQDESFGINLVLIPPADGKPGAFGFQLKWRLD